MNSLFGIGRNNFLTKNISWTADTIKASLLSMSSAAGKISLVNAASNATPIAIGTTAAHGINVGDIVVIGGVGGNLAANGTWQAGTGTSGSTLNLTTRLDNVNSTGSGAWTSGGWVLNLSQAAALSDVSANSVGTDVTLTGTSATLGVATASNWTWTNLPATKVWGFVLYDSTNNDLIGWIDGTFQLYVITQAASSSTAIAVARLPVLLPSSPLPTIVFSDGSSATLTAQNALGDTSIAVSSTAATIHRQATADVVTNQCGFPVTPAAGGNLSVTVDSGPSKLFAL